MHNTQAAIYLASIYTENAQLSEILGVTASIDNNSDGEILIADLDRGLTWYVKPHSSLFLKLDNPDIVNLRISDIHHRSVKYVTIGAGSVTKPVEVEWEDSDYWAFPLYERGDSAMGTTYTEIIGYTIMKKSDGTVQNLNKKEFKEFKKQRDNNN